MMSSVPTPRPASIHSHAVQFYDTDASLLSTVGGFLSEGLASGHPSIVIATREHAKAIADQLAARQIDVNAATGNGDFVSVDAEETLATFMVDGMPHVGRFEYHVGGLIKRTVARQTGPVRAYGEMVDVLWKQGHEDAAIRLEILWNKLATVHAFALLCGYSMGNFYKKAARFDEVCRHHAHVLPLEPSAVGVDRCQAETPA